MQKTILIIIPVFNEVENLQAVLNELKTEIHDADILVVNDGSTDHTQTILENRSDIHWLSLPFNVGYSLALKAGFRYATRQEYDLVLQFDGDGQHLASEAEKLINYLIETKSDIVIGSRFMEKSDYPHSSIRKLGTGIFHSMIRFFCGQSIYDPTSGFQALSRRVVQLYSEMPYFPQFPDANLIVDMILRGYKVTEIPVKMRPRLAGKGMHENIFSSGYYMMLMLYNIFIILVKHGFRKKGELK